MQRRFTDDTPFNAVFIPHIQIRKGDIVHMDADFNDKTKAYEYFLIRDNIKYQVSARTYGRIVERSTSL